VLLAQLTQRTHRTSAEQTEVPDFGREALIDGLAHDPARTPMPSRVSTTVPFPAGALCRHDVVALSIQLQHPRQNFGRVLQVGVHDDDGVACREVQSGGYRGLVPKMGMISDRSIAQSSS